MLATPAMHEQAARLRAFIKLGRPQFLAGGLVFYGLGAALAVQAGPIDWRRYLLGQLLISTTQLMTHYANDYFDLEADRANATPIRWSGGSRVLPNGLLLPRVALIAALVLAAGATFTALLLAAGEANRPLLLPFSLLLLVLSWSYSAPPLRLLARGLGELTTALVVTLLTPLFAFYLQRGILGALPALASAPLCGLQFAMLLTIEIPDAAGDALTSKRTLVVRHGPEWGARSCAGITLASFIALPALYVAGLPGRVALCAALLAPVALWQAIRILRGAARAPARWESLSFWSVALLVLTALAEITGAVWNVPPEAGSAVSAASAASIPSPPRTSSSRHSGT